MKKRRIFSQSDLIEDTGPDTLERLMRAREERANNMPLAKRLIALSKLKHKVVASELARSVAACVHSRNTLITLLETHPEAALNLQVHKAIQNATKVISSTLEKLQLMALSDDESEDLTAALFGGGYKPSSAPNALEEPESDE